MSKQIGVPKGMRDFSPVEMARRNYIFDTIRAAYKSHGFQCIETPTMERRETLMGKYGEEGDRLIFQVLNSGDFLAKADQQAISDKNSKALQSSIAEKALRYDLTVPFARYVVQHQNDITFPFKRYQIQPVWRADRPQKGRYREFFQCDADIIGSSSLLNELELMQLFDAALSKLGLKDFTIKLNNRKILAGIAEWLGRPELLIDITVAMDKIDKIGEVKVLEELRQKGLKDAEIRKVKELFEVNKDSSLVLSRLGSLLGGIEMAEEGLSELNYLLDLTKSISWQNAKIEIDLTLARGLNYYTGAIFEVIGNEHEIGSICGGGRYADLTGIFGLPNMSGVGISFGADRIYDSLLALDRFPEHLNQSTDVLIVNFGEATIKESILLANEAREKGYSVEIYPDEVKMKKQFKYANAKSIEWVLMLGESELKEGLIEVKNLVTGDQKRLSREEFFKQK